MFSLNSSDRYLLYKGDCDMRRGAYSLSGLVRNELRRNPLNGDVFVFLNRRRTCIKLLRWESGGFVLFSKHLEKGTYTRPAGTRSNAVLSWAELVLMIEGIVVKKSVQKPRYQLFSS
ncbi:IS66 family insertion sequence element accessory protein TnpB [Dyadobacter frigoris]|uniref:IS66 family insertion sequence element accessory protein TnpB n=1 Tax=Dyadobacter frigoris TaxID=2576211 RepID=UPI0025530558|nr:IS66 family insertion sequence element accessory protein TnpB [Dyadobacter frigoris]